jgi:peptide deformylase
MAIREVITIPNPVLRKKANEVKQFGEELQTLIEDMIETMRNEPGVGLAAPQVNVSLRVIVVEYPEDEEDENAQPRLFVVVNPEIIRASEEKVMGTEGCLSVPGLIGDVERHAEITVKEKLAEGSL